MSLAHIRYVLAMLTLVGAALGSASGAWAQAPWTELTPQQQEALAPLAIQWSQLNAVQQRNWMAVSRHYARMMPDEQQILQNRMTEWAALTPNQRNQARFNFNAIKSSLSAEERRAKWEEYRNLPQAEKERLAKNHRVLRGTAPDLRPPLPGRLVKPPAPPPTATPALQVPNGVYGSPRYVLRVVIPDDRNTLLPKEMSEAQNHMP